MATWKEPGKKQVLAHFKHYSGRCLETKKTTKSHNKHSVPAEQNLKTATRESEAGMLSMVTYGGRKISNVTVGKQFLQM